MGYTEQELSDEWEYERLVEEAETAWRVSMSVDGHDSSQADWRKDQLHLAQKDLRQHQKRMRTNAENRELREIDRKFKQDYRDEFGEDPPYGY